MAADGPTQEPIGDQILDWARDKGIAISKGTGRLVANTAKGIWNHRSLKKRTFDAYIDPAIAVGATIAALPIGIDWLVEHTVNTYNNAGALAGAYASGIAASVLVLDRLAPKMAKKLYERNMKLRKEVKPTSALSYLRTAALAGGVIAMAAIPTNNAIENIAYDAANSSRITSAPVSEAPIVRIVEESPLEAELAQPANGSTVYLGGNLTGMNVSSAHHKLFTGLEGVVTENSTLNPEQLINNMWQRKADWLERRDRKMSGAAQTFWNNEVKNYDFNQDERMSLDQFLARTDQNLRTVKESIDWSTIANTYGLNSEQLDVTRAVSNSITSEHILAYGLSELNDSRNGSLNVEVFDFMLRNFGMDYVSMIPAMYDEYASIGPWQFTSLALYDVNGVRRGASRANQALPVAERIPGSVVMQDLDGQVRSAYLFAINNIAVASNGLNRRQRGIWLDVLDESADDLAGFLAAVHHNPRHGIQTLERWLDNRAEYEFTVSASSVVKDEVDKSVGNYKAVLAR